MATMPHSYPKVAARLQQNDFVMIEDRPCKIVDINKVPSNNQLNLVGFDIFTGKKLEFSCPPTQSVRVPNVSRSNLKVAHVGKGKVTLLDTHGHKVDRKCISEDIMDEIKEMASMDDDCKVELLKACGEELVTGTCPPEIGFSLY